ncbi:LysM peptidoglycan-binding domain-containing protein [Arthrobacter sp. TMS1-12-1]
MKSSDTIQAGMILGCGVVTTGAGAALLAVREPKGGQGLEGVLGVILSGIGVAVVGVWLLLFLVAVLAELLQRRGPSAAATCASRCAPAVMRRLAAALLGVNLLAAPAMAEAATAGPERPPRYGATLTALDGPALGAIGHAAAAGASGTSDGGPHPASGAAVGPSDRQGAEEPSPPTVRDTPDAASLPTPPSASPPVSPAWKPVPLAVDGNPLLREQTRNTVDAAEVVVAPGDSLWSITGAHLGPLATAADIAEAWPAWYDTNRAVIGIDPSLLLPGTVLRAPAG